MERNFRFHVQFIHAENSALISVVQADGYLNSIVTQVTLFVYIYNHLLNQYFIITPIRRILKTITYYKIYGIVPLEFYFLSADFVIR